MTGPALLIAAAVATPLAMLLACTVPGLRRRLPPLLALAPLPALAAALFADATPLVLGNARFALAFALDEPGRMLLLVAAILWIAAGVYAASGQWATGQAGGFVECWLMTLTGGVGVFLAADLIGFYFLLAVLSVGASGLVLQGDGPEARRASAIYLGLALTAEALLLAGLIMLAAVTPAGSLLIRDAAAALPASPWRDLTLALLIFGLGMKAGLVPLHVWMPLAYGAAPIPAAAVMSGAVVKASTLALIRLLPFDLALPDFGLSLATIGFLGAFYGVAIGITQPSPKIVLAYSSVSQMGFLVAVIGIGLAAGDVGAPLSASFYAVHHLLVKGALFLAVGVIAMTGRRRLWLMLLPAAVLALGIGGLPLTGGALAKLAVKPVLGNGLMGLLETLSAIGTTLLMLHFVERLAASAAPDPSASAPIGVVLPWLLMFAVAIAVPWTLYLVTGIGTGSAALQPGVLWAGLWPVLTGALLVLGLWGRRLPQAPAGDIVVVGERAMGTIVAWSHGVERLDDALRRWPVAALLLLMLTLFLGGTLMGGR